MKTTTTIVWMAMAIIAFSFNLLAAEPQTVQQKSKVKSIEWVVIKDGEIYSTCEYSSGKIKTEVIYGKKDKEISNGPYLNIKEEYLFKATAEIKGLFKTMNEFNKFLIDHHDEFFKLESENQIVDFIKKNAPKRKTVTF